MWNRLKSTVVVGLAAMLAAGTASAALLCGADNDWVCLGTADQYTGGFRPSVGYGGFGGASSCTPSKTPVIFLHGNGDSAISWDMPPMAVTGYATPPRSVYDEFKFRGYKDCELFGVTYLSPSEAASPQDNYHESSKYDIINGFVDQVLAYTGASKVDIVTHSMGSSMAIAAFEYSSNWSKVRRFVNIAGGLRGIQSCLLAGPANPYAMTCGSENWWDAYTFGFYPGGASTIYYNLWTGSGTGSMRAMPSTYTGVVFYTIAAGAYDQVGCSSSSYFAGCNLMSKFDTATNVKAQVNVGFGTTAGTVDWDWEDGSPFESGGGDSSGGVGHFLSKTNAGKIIYTMLSKTIPCSSASACASLYSTTTSASNGPATTL